MKLTDLSITCVCLVVFVSNEPISLQTAKNLKMQSVFATIAASTFLIPSRTTSLMPHWRRNIPKDFAELWCRWCSLTSMQVVQSHFNATFHWQFGVQPQPKRSQQAALATGSQPVKKIQPLVSEYSHVQVLKRLPPQFERGLDNRRCITHCLQCGPTIVHQGAKLLRRTLINGGGGMTTDGLAETDANFNLSQKFFG